LAKNLLAKISPADFCLSATLINSLRQSLIKVWGMAITSQFPYKKRYNSFLPT
jgi:hypothetical protein